MKEYNYNGYTIKEERSPWGLGLTWAIYKNEKLIGYADREKIAKETADWHAQYGKE